MVPPAVSDPLSLGNTVRPDVRLRLDRPFAGGLPAAGVRVGVARDQGAATW